MKTFEIFSRFLLLMSVFTSMIVASNHAPNANAVSVTTTQDTAVLVTLSGNDPDGDPVVYSIVTGPSHGTLSGSEPSLTYTPNSGYTGTDLFTYRVCEDTHQPGALCTDANVTITVNSSGGGGGCSGCDCSYDSGSNEVANDTSPGVKITQLDGTTTYTQKCISGISDGTNLTTDKDYYYFDAGADGNITINTSSPNNHAFHLKVTNGDTVIYPDNSSMYNHHVNFQVSQGDRVILYFKETGSDIDKYEATITFTPAIQTVNYECANPKAYGIISQYNTQGNIKLVGNSNVCKKDSYGNCTNLNGSESNNNVDMTWRDGDANTNTINSSAAKLVLPLGAEVLWAGLYWQGSLHHPEDYAHWQTEREETAHIKFGFTQQSGKIEVNYNDITADRHNWIYVWKPNGTSRYVWYYQGYKDVTTIVQHDLSTTTNNTGWFWGADINSSLDKGDGGSYAAWSLSIIYKDTNQKIKNLTVFDGFMLIGIGADATNAERYRSDHNCASSGVEHNTSVTLTGFKTPAEGDVNSILTFFAGEGDPWIGDYMKLSDISDTPQLVSSGNVNPPNNIANSSISINDTRLDENDLYPYWGKNMIGIDIDTFDVSNIISNNQTRTTVQLGTDGDGFLPGIFGLATELYKPTICYDYVSKLNEFVIPYKDHTSYRAYAKQGDELSFTVAIWDITGDIDPKYVSIGLPVTQHKGHVTPVMNPDKAYYTIPNGNTLLPTDYANMSTPKRPVITIGDGRTADVGGTISHDQRYFAKYYFEVQDTNASVIAGDYDIEVNATFNYGSGDFWQIMDLDRCEQNLTYAPTWVQFNVEQDFDDSNVPSDPTAHYSLPTRIAGKDFNYDVASYGKDSNGQYTLPISANGVTVDVEMIDISDFDDNGSFFKCGNSDPNVIIMPGKFTYFDNNQTRMSVNDSLDLSNTSATRNATFRMWLLTDENGTLLTSDKLYKKDKNDHYAEVYENNYRAQDINGLCSSACTKASGYNYTSLRYHNIHYDTDPNAVGCYACLRDYFAQPYCARDNFAIRPKAIRVDAGDKGLNGTLNSKPIAVNIDRPRTSENPNKDVSIAAEYPYELNMTTVNIRDNKVNGYTTLDLYQKQTDITSIPDKRFSSMALVKFEGDTSKCTDTTHSSLNPHFASGFVSTELNTTNAGAYSFEIWDSNWTTVDRAVNNPYKTLFSSACKNNIDPACNDCILGTTAVNADPTDPYEKIGCTFSSELTRRDGTPDPNYTKLDLKINPYTFKIYLDPIHIQPSDTNTSWVYMNNMADPALTLPGAAAQLDVNVTAKGAHDGNLTNFTLGCAAEDTVFWLDRNMSRPENTIATENTADPVYFQQWLDADYGSTQPVQDTTSGTDMNATLPKENYRSDQNGTAYHVRINYNFKKPYNDFVNPVIVDFQALHAASPDAVSYADHKSHYIPEGNVTVDENKTFLFAKVAPKIGDEFITTYDSNYTTFLRIDTFCKDTLYITCSNLQVANILGSYEEANNDGSAGAWYRASYHDGSKDGQVNQLRADNSGIAELPLTAITFDNNGSTSDITLTYGLSNTRPKNFTLTIDPDVWLKYNKNNSTGLPTFSIRYLFRGLRWKGEGNTGHVITTQPYSGTNKRMNW